MRILAFTLFLTYNNNVMNVVNEKYSWDPEKRELNIKERGLDFVLLRMKYSQTQTLLLCQIPDMSMVKTVFSHTPW